MAMKGQDLYEALSRVDPAMLEAAAEPPRQQRAWRRPAVIAACAALLLAGTAVAVFCGVEIRILDVEDPETYMPYRVKLPTEADAAFQVEGQVETTPTEVFFRPAAGRRRRRGGITLLTPGKKRWPMRAWRHPARRDRPT